MFSRKVLVRMKKINCSFFSTKPTLSWNVGLNPELDISYLCKPENLQEISENIAARKGVGDIKLVHQLKDKLGATNPNDETYKTLQEQFNSELYKIPNKTHPAVIPYGTEPKTIKTVGSKSPPGLDFQEIAKKLKLVRTDQLGNFAGSKSYYVLGELAELEHALVRSFVTNLIKNKFELISVPDILHRQMVEGCGMNTRGTRTQVYQLDEKLHGADLCLSGTSEIALAGYLSQKTLPGENLPLRLAAVSRCYRAETSNLQEERGIYRVHEFTKVEMFVVATPLTSDAILEEIRQLQETLFESLGLHFRVLDMPPHELGAQAYRKYDVEAWMAGRGAYGEISSCSNCLDYQARRLGIRLTDGAFAHTLNGTACAIPRLLIALVEGGQKKGVVEIPEVLRQFMGGKSVIGKQKKVPELKLIKTKK